MYDFNHCIFRPTVVFISLFTMPTLFSKSVIFSFSYKWKRKVRFTKENGDIKLWRLVTCESLELQQSYIHHLKALMCGINASRGHGHGCRFIMCHVSVKIALLLGGPFFETRSKNLHGLTSDCPQIDHWDNIIDLWTFFLIKSSKQFQRGKNTIITF